MQKKISLIICIVLTISLTFGTMNLPVDARTTSLEDGAYEAIQKAISEAAPGDTIILPSGEFVIVKPISINKPITLKGTVADGVLQTVIKGQSANYINVFSDGVRIENIKFEGRLGLSTNEHAINIGDYINFVVKNCEFLNVSYRGVLVTGNRAKGVITGCRFENIYNGTGVVIYGVTTGSGDNLVNTFWDTYPTMDELKSNLGTDNAIYIEDCYFTKGMHAVASNEGGRYVFRYNTMDDPDGTGHSVDTHGLEYQSKRGTRSFEIYNNTLTNSYPHYANIWLRGGDGVVFNNTMTSSTNGLFSSHTSEIGQPDPAQIPYPAKDQTRALYAWNNTLDGNPANVVVKSGHEYLLQENRDFFNYELSGYEPYTYPHPLAAEPVSQAPEIWSSKVDYVGGTHSLGTGNTGRQMVKFDFEAAVDNINGTVGYAEYGASVTDQVYMAMEIHFDTNGFFKVLNDNAFESITDVPYVSSETYQVKMDIDPLLKTYNVWVKPESGAEILIAENYSFRSGLNPADIGTICLVSNNDDDFSVTDHSIFSYTPFGNVPGAWYSKPSASNGFVDGLHVLEPNFTGTVQMEFDFTPHGNSINGVVGFGGKDTDITGYASFSFMFRAYTSGKFDAYDNKTYTALTSIPYTADTTYHVKIITDLGSNTYDAWVSWITPDGEVTYMLADDYKYRALTPNIDDIGKLCLVSTNMDDFRVQNFTAKTIGPATTPTPTATPTPTESPEPESLLIEDLVVNNSATLWTIQKNLQPGDLQYADRTFTFDSIPEEVIGCEWIRNANGSKGFTGETLATFKALSSIDVYIAFSTSISPLPSWMQEGWEDTGENIVNQESATAKKTYRLYKKFFEAGSTVVLGPNSTANHGMYNIILKQRPELTDDIIITPIDPVTVEAEKVATVTIETNVEDAVITAEPENPETVGVSVYGKIITITGLAEGSTVVGITAAKDGYVSGTASFEVEVTPNSGSEEDNDDDDEGNGNTGIPEDDDDDDTGTVTPIPTVTPEPTDAPSPTPVIPSNVIIVEESDLDTQSGIAKATITIEKIEEAFSNADADEQGNKAISVEMAGVEGATGYVLVFPVEILTNETPGRQIELKTETASLVIPSNILSNTDVSGAKEVSLTVAYADASLLPEEVRDIIGDRPVVELILTMNGIRVSYNNPDAPVTVSIPYNPTAEELEKPENIVIWYIDGEGNVIPVTNCRYDDATGMVTFTTTHFSNFAVTFVVKSFNDLAGHPWAKEQVEAMAARGVINGVGDNAFAPGDSITRADFILLLIRSLGLTAKADSNFADVSSNSHYYEALGIAKKLGLAKGVGENLFNPNEEISRQDMMVLAARAMRLANAEIPAGSSSDLQPFADSSEVAAYAKDDVAAMIKSNLIKGYSGKINPYSTTTRAEAAVLIYRLFYK